MDPQIPENEQDKSQKKRVYEKVVPINAQQVGSQGLTIPNSICDSIIAAVKQGDFNKFHQELQKYGGIQPRDVLSDSKTQFNQNLMFAAVLIHDEEKAIEMMKQLIQMGVDPYHRDSLKQTPMFYAARDGKLQVIQFLIDQELSVNDIDVYGQNPIYYAVNLGHINACKLLVQNGSYHDYVDENGETPLYYAIKSNRVAILEYLISLGCNLEISNNKQINLVSWAQKQNKPHLKDILLKNGAPLPIDNKSSKKQAQQSSIISQQDKKKQANEQSQDQINYEQKQIQAFQNIQKQNANSKENELEKIKEFSLQIKVGESFRPITVDEFQQFANTHPEIAKYFLDENEIKNIKVPKIDDLSSSQIFYHWEKACSRMIQNLMKIHSAWIFNQPVDAEKLGIVDYHDIIKNPMDFLTIKEKLKRHEYNNIEQFISDIQLVFTNCIKYNGQESRAGMMCREVQNEFKNLFVQLNFKFYITDENFNEDQLIDN